MKLSTLLLCASLLAVTVPAAAEVGREAAAAAAQRETGGRVLAVDRTQAGGRTAWRVKVVTKGGEVRVVLIDAASGRPM